MKPKDKSSSPFVPTYASRAYGASVTNTGSRSSATSSIKAPAGASVTHDGSRNSTNSGVKAPAAAPNAAETK